MDKRAIFNHFSEILDSLIDTYSFFAYWTQYPYSMEEDIYGCGGPLWNVYFGATRACIEDSTYPYVVKIDVDDFHSCDEEQIIYRSARKHNLDKYFAETEYVGTYTRTFDFYDANDLQQYVGDDCWYFDESEFARLVSEAGDELGERYPITVSIPLYAYVRAYPHDYQDTYGALSHSKHTEYENAAQKVDSPLRERNLAVAIDFIKEYGEEEYQRISEFLQEWNINDLHSANFADTENGFICIDFAGYHRDE